MANAVFRVCDGKSEPLTRNRMASERTIGTASRAISSDSALISTRLERRVPDLPLWWIDPLSWE